MPNYAYHKHHLHLLAAHYHSKASCEISASSLKDFLRKSEKCKKRRNQSLLMSSFRKIIFDLQITIDRVHLVRISSHSDYCITTDMM